MVRGRPIVLKNGDYLLPVYHETGHDPEKVGADSTSLFLRFNPRRRAGPGPARSARPKGNIQPAVVSSSDNHLIAYCRRGGDYDPKTIGYIVRSESHDGGLTWSEGKDTAFPNPNAAVDFIKLQSGRLLLIYNNSMNRRTPLTAALSYDQDRTWPSAAISARATATSATQPHSRLATAGSISCSPRSAARSSTTRCSMKIGSSTDAEIKVGGDEAREQRDDPAQLTSPNVKGRGLPLFHHSWQRLNSA